MEIKRVKKKILLYMCVSPSPTHLLTVTDWAWWWPVLKMRQPFKSIDFVKQLDRVQEEELINPFTEYVPVIEASETATGTIISTRAS